jgi:hypothetical protein
MKALRLCLSMVWMTLLAGVFAAGQEMVLQFSFPTEGMLAQDVYIKYGAGLARDRAGNIWVVDSGQGVLQEFDAAGRFLKKTGRPGQGPGEFSRPGTIHVTEAGDLLVLDVGNMRLSVLSGQGEFKRTLKLTRRYEDFCEFRGKIYLIFNGPREDGKIADVLSLAGEPLGSIGEAPDFGSVAPYNIRIPYFRGISSDPKGRLLVGWNFFSMVRVLDAGRKETMKIEIDDLKLKERSRNNLGELNKEKGLISWVVPRIRAHRGGFLALVPAERIEFLDCDMKGKVRATYWAPSLGEDYLGRDFICCQDGRTTWIYVLQTRPESKVNVYKIRTRP